MDHTVQTYGPYFVGLFNCPAFAVTEGFFRVIGGSPFRTLPATICAVGLFDKQASCQFKFNLKFNVLSTKTLFNLKWHIKCKQNALLIHIAFKLTLKTILLTYQIKPFNLMAFKMALIMQGLFRCHLN